MWSLGATVWEMAETEPPFAATQQFSDRWPPLTRNPETLSPYLREFLRLCSEPPAARATPSELGKVCSFHSHLYGNLTSIFRLNSLAMRVDGMSLFNFFLNVWPLSRYFGKGIFRMDPLRNSIYPIFCINLIGFHCWVSIS